MRRSPIALFALLSACLAPSVALADDTIRRPGEHPKYNVEIEPHLLLGWGGVAGSWSGSAGIGPGVRFGIPIVENGFIPTINNSIAISFGADILYYGGGCGYANGLAVDCSAWYFEFPVTMQWNFYVSQRWSVFGEPGLFPYHAEFPNNGACYYAGPGHSTCAYAPSGFAQNGVLPAFFAGARYHFSDKAALTFRVGYPTISIGVSFFP
jgi:hypothetical protein